MRTDGMLEKRWLACAALVVLAIVPYLNTFSNPFMWDDIIQIPENPSIRYGWKSVVMAFDLTNWGIAADIISTKLFYRPFHSILSTIDYSMWGLNPLGYHITNTLLHLGNTLLFYAVAVKLSNNRTAAFVGAAIFAVHPAHTEAVTFISSRPDLLSALFLQISFLLYMASGRAEKGGMPKGAFSLRHVLSLVFFVFALLSKEMALMLPVFIAVYSVLFEPAGGRLKRIVPFFALLAAYILFRVFAMSQFANLHGMKVPLPTLAYSSSVVVLDYMRLLVFPWPLRTYYDTIWYSAVGWKVALAFAVMLGSAAIALGALIKGKRLVAFSILWLYLGLAPVLNIGTLGEFSMAERYLYTPSIGFCLLFGLVVVALLKKGGRLKAATPYAVSLIVVVFIVMTMARNRVWSTDLLFYGDMAAKAPLSTLPHANLAHAYMRDGQNDKAAEEYLYAINIAQANHELRYELGMLYIRMDRPHDALGQLQKAVSLKPDFAKGLNALGVAYAETGDLNRAEMSFRSALANDPGSADAARNLQRVIDTK